MPGLGPLGLLGNSRPAQLEIPATGTSTLRSSATSASTNRVQFQLRGEVTNVFNLTNLGAPSASMNSSNFGQVTGSGGTQRIIQVGGRILF